MRTAFLTLVFAGLALAGCSEKKESATTETVTTGAATTPQDDSGPAKVVNMDAAELNTWFQQGSDKKFTVLDVRTPEEFSGGSLPGAQNVDFLAEDFQSKVSVLDKETTWVVICAAGKRSASAAQQMADMGFKNIWALNGGLNAWTGSGYSLAH